MIERLEKLKNALAHPAVLGISSVSPVPIQIKDLGLGFEGV